jgi:hypothetical protein
VIFFSLFPHITRAFLSITGSNGIRKTCLGNKKVELLERLDYWCIYSMPVVIDPQVQTMLVFESLEKMYDFKHEIACQEFYIERDAKAFVGFFTPEQVLLAITKYNAVSRQA